MNYIDIPDTSNSSMLLLTAMQAASGQTAEQFILLLPWYVFSLVRFRPDALSALGNVIFVDGPAYVSVVILGPALVQTRRMNVGEGLRVYGRFSSRSGGPRGEVLERRAYSTDDRGAFRAWRRRLLLAVPVDFALIQTQSTTEWALEKFIYNRLLYEEARLNTYRLVHSANNSEGYMKIRGFLTLYYTFINAFINIFMSL